MACGVKWSYEVTCGFPDELNSVKRIKGASKGKTTQSKSRWGVLGQSKLFCSAVESFCAASAPNGHTMRGLPSGCAAVARSKGIRTYVGLE